MDDERHDAGRHERSPAERIVDRHREEAGGGGRPLSRASMQRERTLESYFEVGSRPRWMERLVEIERGIARERARIGRLHRELWAECGDDAEGFARRWTSQAHRLVFDDVNELIRQHNDWYPIERQLPMDPRTRDYVLLAGRSYRHRELDAAWVLEEFPAVP